MSFQRVFRRFFVALVLLFFGEFSKVSGEDIPKEINEERSLAIWNEPAAKWVNIAYFERSSNLWTSTLFDEHFNIKAIIDPNNPKPENLPPLNCSTASAAKHFNDGVYLLSLPGGLSSDYFYAYCQHEAANEKGWTVIQKRHDGSTNFYRNWHSYKHGFGSAYSEYWIGLERLHIITNSQRHELWIQLEDFGLQTKNAKYTTFKISDEYGGYKLFVEGYSGDAGNSLDQDRFCTFDRDNDPYRTNRAIEFVGAWWSCMGFVSDLNGEYYSVSNKEIGGDRGIKWNSFSTTMSLRTVFMAIRPV